MTAYVIRRLWQMIPTLAGVILLIFILFNWIGGDPAHVLAGKISNPEQIANIRKQLGVDQPFWYQLLVFVKQVFTFDFGPAGPPTRRCPASCSRASAPPSPSWSRCS